MARATKEVLTKEGIEDSLLTFLRGDKRFSSYLGAITGFLMLPFIFFSGSLAIRNITQGKGAPEIVLSIFLFLFFVALAAIFLILYFNARKRVKRIKEGAFSVRVDKVTYMTEKMRYNGRHMHLAQIFEFCECGEVEVDALKYSLTSLGDEYYLVFIEGDKKPTLIYARKIYDYNE